MAIKYRFVEGNRRLGRPKDFALRLGRIAPKVKKRINAANEKSAEDLAALMVRSAPKDEGDLIASIKYYEVTGTVGGGIVWRVAAGDDNAPHARWVEFGAAKNVDPHPFFYSSWIALRRLIKNRQARAWRQGIKDSDT